MNKLKSLDPELEQINLIKDRLANEYALYDLTPEQNTFFSIIDALHHAGYEMPITMKFKENFLNYSQSRDRLGRQELVIILRGFIEYAVTKLRNKPFEEPEVRYQPQTQKSGNIPKYIFYIILIAVGLFLMLFYGGH